MQTNSTETPTPGSLHPAGSAMWHNMPVDALIPKLAEALSICAGALSLAHPDADADQERKAAQEKALAVLQECHYEAWQCWPNTPDQRPAAKTP